MMRLAVVFLTLFLPLTGLNDHTLSPNVEQFFSTVPDERPYSIMIFLF